jgi:electron transfer flavoprotein alpha subunit
MAQIWVIADQAERAYELLAKARELADASGGLVACFVAGDETIGKEAVSLGADEAYLLAIPETGLWESFAPVLAEKAQKDNPRVILVSATKRGKDLGAQLAALLDAPMASDCQLLELDGGKATCERMLYGGLGVQRLECESFPLLASFGPRSFDKPAADPSRTGEVQSMTAAQPSGVRVLERVPKQSEGVELSEADLVIGVGRGFEDESQLALAKDAARALGAELACSRPIAEHFKWLPEDRYLGISGQQIKASLYLACGISGQVQHLYGIRDVKTIVAVNSDSNAPIFNLADYYVVGDLAEFLPAFSGAVKAAKG